jgi:hypothetical protein
VRLLRRSPAPGSRVFAQAELAEVRLQWDGKEGDVLEWDTDSEFGSPKSLEAAGDVRVGLAPGHYHWRVRRKERSSDSADFTLMPPARYEIRSPASNAVLKRKKRPVLEWAPVQGASAYIVEVSLDPLFSSLAFEGQSEAPTVELPLLPHGKYFWRVRAQAVGGGEWPSSGAATFTVKAPLAAPKPKGVRGRPGGGSKKEGSLSPLKDRLLAFAGAIYDFLIPEARAEEEDVLLWEFAWEPIQGAAGYRLEIALDAKFRSVVRTKEVTATSVALRLPLGRRYYWRVAAFDEDREVGRFSRAQTMTAPRRKIVAARPLRRLATQGPPKPAPPPKPPRTAGFGWLAPSWVRLGAGGGFVSQSVTSSAETIQSSGFPLGDFALYLHRSFAASELELGLSYHRLRFRTKDTAIAAFQPDLLASQWGAHLFYKGLFGIKSVPVTVGLGARSVADLHKVASETAAAGAVTYSSLYLGLSPWQGSDPSSFWQTDLLLEVSPFGAAAGAGLWLRGRMGLWNLAKPLTAELQVLLRPSYRRVAVGARSQINLESSVSLVVGGLFDASPRWVD